MSTSVMWFRRDLRLGNNPAIVHTPWELDELPAGYVAPIVDHAEERREALRRYEAIR